MGGAPATTTWRGVIVDPITADYLDAVAAEVTTMTRAAGVPDFTVTPIPRCGSYQTSTAASAGTHAGGGAIDLNAEGLTDQQARILESAARKWGGTAWFRPRYSPSGRAYGWQRHVHILRSDCTDLASEARSQVVAYRAGRNGLADRGRDTGNRSWVNVTWGAVKGVADAIGGIGGAVADAANNPPPKPKPEPVPEEDIVASLAEVEALIRKVIKEEVAKAVWSTPRWKGSNGVEYNPGSWLIGANEKAGRGESYGRQGVAQVAGLASGLKAASSNPAITPAQITAAAKAGASAALDERITDAAVTLNVAP